MRKKSKLKRLKIKENSNYYTKKELDAIDYFHGNGFYQKYEDPKLKPNIFDTRQTFLFKFYIEDSNLVRKFDYRIKYFFKLIKLV